MMASLLIDNQKNLVSSDFGHQHLFIHAIQMENIAVDESTSIVARGAHSDPEIRARKSLCESAFARTIVNWHRRRLRRQPTQDRAQLRVELVDLRNAGLRALKLNTVIHRLRGSRSFVHVGANDAALAITLLGGAPLVRERDGGTSATTTLGRIFLFSSPISSLTLSATSLLMSPSWSLASLTACDCDWCCS